MGRKSREKKERKTDGISRKKLKELRRNSTIDMYPSLTRDGAYIALNPLKRMCKAKGYKDPTGLNALINTFNQNAAFLNQQKEKNKDKESK